MNQPGSMAEIKSYQITWPCAAETCPATLRVTCVCAPEAANEARQGPPPDAKGWVNGLCPHCQE